jgi:hypothetical protein
MKIQANTVKIEKVNYFGEATNTQDFNAKVIYRKNGRSYIAHIFVDFFNKRVHEGRNNPKEHKAVQGFMKAINEFAEQTNWRFKK